MNDFLTQPVGKLYMRFLPSSIISLLLVSVASLVDTIVVAHFMGPVAMSAAGICMPIFASLIAISMLIVNGASTLYGHCIGKEDYVGANRYFTLSAVVVIVIGIVYTVGGMLFTDSLIRFLGANDVIFDMAKEYGQIVFRFSLAYILFPLVLTYVRIDMDPGLTVIGIIASGIINAALDILFVGPYLTPNGFGLAGAAYATCISYTIGDLIMAIHFLKKNNTLKYAAGFFSFAALGKSILTGIPSSITMLGNAITQLVFNNVIIAGANRQGELYVAVYSVIVQVMTVSMSTYVGAASCAQPIIAANYSAEKKDRVKKLFSCTMIGTVGLNAALAVVLFFTARWIAGVFAMDKGAVDMMGTTVIAIRVFAASLIFAGMNQVFLYLLQSTDDLVNSSIISFLSSTVLMIAGIYLFDGLLLRNSEVRMGIWITYLFAQLVTLVYSLISYRRQKARIFG